MSSTGPFPRKKKAVKRRLKSSKPEFEHEEYEAASKANPEQTKQAEALAEQSPAEFWSQSLKNSLEQPVENVGTLTDLDKLYMALAEVKKEHYFNTLCFGLGINSLNALENYSIGSEKAQSRIIASRDLADLKKKLKKRPFHFYQLAEKYQRSNVHETCRVKGIPVIQKQDVSVTKAMGVGPLAGYVCEAQWTRPDGVQQKVCLRYDEKVDIDTPFLHEAEMANVLRHKNMLSIYGVVTGSSYSPTFALVVEFAEYGNLYESRDFRTIEELCRFTIQAATALEYIESKGIIHQAVNSNTCLVVSKTEERRQSTSFGTFTAAGQAQSIECCRRINLLLKLMFQMKLGGLGSCHYDTEMKNHKPAYTQKDVVYQFAKLFSVHFVDFDYKVRVTDENLASSFKASAGKHGYACPSHFCDVLDSCLQENPEARPSFKEIRESLLAQKFPSKVRVTTRFVAESPDFIGYKTGELITLIAKDRHKEDKTVWLGERQDRKIGFFKSEHVKEVLGYDIMDDSFVPPEIRARGPEAELAFQKALQNGKVKVYRGRIMLLGQDRAGKTSLKKSLLGMPFNPQEESTVGVEVDPSKCQVDVDEIKNWEPIKDKKLEVSEFAEDIAMLIAKDLSKGQADKQDISQPAEVLEERNRDELDGRRPKQSETLSPVAQSTTNIKPESTSELHDSRDDNADGNSSSSSSDQGVQLNIDTTAVLSDDVTELVIQYLERLKLDDDIKAREVILTLWDFAGQHLYYASHPVFLSPRAVYVLVYNLSKSLSAEAEPCVRQGIHDLLLDNPNSETNLDSLLAWLVSVHSIRRPTESKAVQGSDHQGRNLTYLRPPVFIVGTNADHPFEDPKKMEKCIERGISGNTFEEHVIRPFFAVDNTQSQSDDGIQKLQKKIMEVLKREPYMGEEVPIRWFNFEKVVEALVAKKTFHMSLDQLLTVTRRVCQIEDDAELTAMLNFYHDLGVIVKHGHTVVLQAQWLINLFKQLITVPPFNEVDPLFSKCWRELEENGILRMALVDHVFTDFIQNGLLKEDILDMMELYGLIGKLSCLTSADVQVQEYFVPAQLRSSPSGLCKIRPSDSDPCPLYIHFPDGFVPHGLFSQLLSRCISWCSQQGLKQSPQLFNNGARLFIGMQSAFELFLMCRKRFIKVVLKMSQRCRSMTGSLTAASTKMANEVRAFVEASLKALTSELSWLQSLQYELCVSCCHCLQNGDQCTKHEPKSCSQEECLHLLPVHLGEEPICTRSYNGELVKVNGLEKWFQAYKAQNDEETLEYPFVGNEILKDFASLKCGKPSTDDLLLIAYDLGSSWKMFGRALHLDKPQLEQIEEDERKLIEKSYGMLKKWLESCYGTATYQCLAVAFKQLGRTDLAAKYCNVHSDPLKDYVALPSSISIKAGTPSSEDLLDIAREFCASWKMFCRALHLTEATLAQIEENERDMVSKCYAVLGTWTEKWGSEATYQRLAQALQHPAVKHSNLAAKYCHLNKSTS